MSENEESEELSSYERINYSLRPAKNVERKLMCEAFRRLSRFGKLDSYRYVGFGSAFFADFLLVHRTLGISDMISIEKDIDNGSRFEFNKPFACVKLEFGLSTGILPLLDWEPRSIVWLDYDGILNQGVLEDVAFLAAKCCSGSVVIFSYNVNPMKEPPKSRSTTPMSRDIGVEAASASTDDAGQQSHQTSIRTRSPGQHGDTRYPEGNRDALEHGEQLNDLRNDSSRVSVVEQPLEPDTLSEGIVRMQRFARKRRQRLEQNVGSARVPSKITGRELGGWGLAEACRQVVSN
jgi:hypothetical protein